MSTTFWERVRREMPEIAGATVYFCPTTRASLPCIVRDDGNVSPVCAPGLRFDSASKLAEAVKNGEIPVHAGFRISKTISSAIYSFKDDFFLQPGRQVRISEMLTQNGNTRLMDVSDASVNADATTTTFDENSPADGPRTEDNVAENPMDVSAVERPEEGSIVQDSMDVSESLRASITTARPNDSFPRGVNVTTQLPTALSTDCVSVVKLPVNADTERFGNVKEFWRIALLVKPTLVGEIVYFCPNTRQSVACVVNGDGTFSPLCDRSIRYFEARPFVQDLISGKLRPANTKDGVFKFRVKHSSVARFSCIDDFFMGPHRSNRIVDILGNFKICRGVDRRRFEDIIKDRRWDEDRNEVSPYIFEETRFRSQRCEWVLFNERRTTCDQCHKARSSLSSLRKKLQNRPLANSDKRLIFTGVRYLTEEDRKKRDEMIQQEHKKRRNELRRQAAKIERLEAELRKYKPKHAVNVDAIRNMVNYLNEETDKTTSPKCSWLADESVDICGFTADSISAMCEHVNTQHLRPQLQSNADIPEEMQNYRCLWKDCNRRRFSTLHQLHSHSFEHTGSRISAQRLLVTRCNLLNLGRPPTARRYNEAVRQHVLNEWNPSSRDSWHSTRMASMFPLPSRIPKPTNGVSSVTSGQAEPPNGESQQQSRESIDIAIQSVIDSL